MGSSGDKLLEDEDLKDRSEHVHRGCQDLDVARVHPRVHVGTDETVVLRDVLLQVQKAKRPPAST